MYKEFGDNQDRFDSQHEIMISKSINQLKLKLPYLVNYSTVTMRSNE